MIVYNKNTNQTLDSDKLNSNEFDPVFLANEPDYHFIKATPQQEADYIKQQSQLQLASNKTTAINQLHTLKTTTIDKLRDDNFANIVKAIATQNQPAIDSIIALDTKLDIVNIAFRAATNRINEAANQTIIDNCITTFTEFLI